MINTLRKTRIKNMDDWTIVTLYLLVLPVILVGLTAFLAWKIK